MLITIIVPFSVLLSYIVAFVLLSVMVPQLELGSVGLYLAACVGPVVALLVIVMIGRRIYR